MKIMLDLETLSTRSNAAVVAIGAAAFDRTGVSEYQFYRVITPRSAEKAGLHISSDTFAWWCAQSDTARSLFADKAAIALPEALHEFSAWCNKVKVDEMWGNGSDFDNVILSSAYEAVEAWRPWKHDQNRCYRTLKAMVSPEVQNALWNKHFVGVHHHALDDAVRQANIAVEIFAQLGTEIAGQSKKAATG